MSIASLVLSNFFDSSEMHGMRICMQVSSLNLCSTMPQIASVRASW